MTEEAIGNEVIGRARLEHLAVVVQEMIEAYDQNEWDRLKQLQDRACILLGAVEPPEG